MGNVLIERDTMVDIADSIRGKTGSVELMKPDEMPQAIDSIPSGGGGSAADPELPVRFFSYDGDLLYSYTLEEVAELEALPPVPEVQGLVSQGWNWTLAELVENGRQADVGPMYITDDGATRVYISLTEGRLSPVLGFKQNKANGVTVDWGDGSSLETSSVLNSAVNMEHTYARAGNYVISLLPDQDATLTIQGSSSQLSTGILVYANKSTLIENKVYTCAVKRIELGRNTSLKDYAFLQYVCLKSISVPAYIQQLGHYAFSFCYGLKMLVIPRGVTTISEQLLINCINLQHVSIPYSVSIIEMMSVCSCYLLDRVALPRTVTEIWDYAFSACYSVRSFCFPDGVTEIKSACMQEMHALQRVDFGDAHIETIFSSAFSKCTSLGTIEIPETVKSIYPQAFANTNCKSIFVYPEKPPTLVSNNVFQGIWNDCVIYVPHGCLAAYQAATNWSDYASHMVEMPE